MGDEIYVVIRLKNLDILYPTTVLLGKFIDFSFSFYDLSSLFLFLVYLIIPPAGMNC